MKKVRLFLQCFSGMLIIITLVSCEVEVPIREIMDAKVTIDRAYEVKAEKYSADNLKKATDYLYECHTFLKDDKIADAKKSAENAKQSALTAINVSLPLLAKDTLDEATKIYNEAETQNAALYAPDEFKKTDDAIKEADKLNKETKYWDSYLKSREAIKTGKAASDKAMASIPDLKNRLDQLSREYDGLKTGEMSAQSETELAAAKTSLDKAKGELDEKKLKNITALLDDAQKNLKQAKDKIDNAANNEKKIAETREKINQLTKELDELKSGKGKTYAGDEITKAETAIGEANELLAKKKPNESLPLVTAAENSIKAAQLKTRQGAAREKLDTVSNLYTSIKTKDTENKYKDNLEKADVLIQSSRKFFENGSYDESMAKSDEAEALLNSTSVTIGKTDDDKKGSGKVEIEIEEKPTYYVVKYRKKDTDCLWRIAMHVYRDAKLWPIIYKANRDQIKDPDLIFPGQKFMIPSIGKKKEIMNEVNEIRSEILGKGMKENKDTKKIDKQK